MEIIILVERISIVLIEMQAEVHLREIIEAMEREAIMTVIIGTIQREAMEIILMIISVNSEIK